MQYHRLEFPRGGNAAANDRVLKCSIPRAAEEQIAFLGRLPPLPPPPSPMDARVRHVRKTAGTCWRASASPDADASVTMLVWAQGNARGLQRRGEDRARILCERRGLFFPAIIPIISTIGVESARASVQPRPSREETEKKREGEERRVWRRSLSERRKSRIRNSGARNARRRRRCPLGTRFTRMRLAFCVNP